tara:strand:+ start:2112 stop:3119 length:1008 start_codon:yes stop_codon:yes gene_type:complete
MSATINSENKHFPVLLKELISIISPLYGGTFIDCTFGEGGYSKEILKNSLNKIIAFDRDKDVLKYANKLKKKFGSRFIFKNQKFKDISHIDTINRDIKAIIFDLGFSTNQIKDLSRGFSFKSNSKLNMKMGLNKFSANEVINNMSYEDLSKIIKFFGDEKKSKLISKLIIKNRKYRKLNTQDLVSVIEKVKKNKKNFKINSSTKTFQAIRIFVNQEINELIYGLINAFKILPIGGMIIVVTFHSIEDKIVKFFLKHYSENNNLSRYIPNQKEKKKIIKLIKKKPIIADVDELNTNPPSRSAKLRYGIKINDSNDFKDFIKKFQFLLDIEGLADKL